MDSELIHQLEAALQELALWKGRTALVDESLSRNRGKIFSHDRHFATRSNFQFEIESVGWSISGSLISLYGRSGGNCSQHQMTIDCLVAVEIVHAKEVVFIEHFETELERRSIIRLKETPGALGHPAGTADSCQSSNP